MQILARLKEIDRQYPIDRAIILGIGLLFLWLIALMTFMENGQNHIVNLVIGSALTALLIGLARILPKTNYQGFLVAIFATMIAVVAFFL